MCNMSEAALKFFAGQLIKLLENESIVTIVSNSYEAGYQDGLKEGLEWNEQQTLELDLFTETNHGNPEGFAPTVKKDRA